jgi:hypothetical protein
VIDFLDDLLRTLFSALIPGSEFGTERKAGLGKRSEVKDSHDRYANLEISYLLQKMESYEGAAILATTCVSSWTTPFSGG